MAPCRWKQVAFNALLSQDIIPPGRFGYSEEDHAMRLMCTATIVEMAVFRRELSRALSERGFFGAERVLTCLRA